jgi:uncharacterized protein YndB with AHSA1/START domain
MMKKILLGVAGTVVALIVVILVTGRIPSTIHVERTLNAPIDKVWRVWTDAESMKSWWSPEHYTAPVIKNDVRVGGVFLFSMRAPNGDMHWNAGTYKEVIPGKKLVSDFSFSDENGKLVPGSEVKMPGKWPDAIQVSTEFIDEGGKTRVVIEEVGVPLVIKVLAKMGWEQQLDKFERLL